MNEETPITQENNTIDVDAVLNSFNEEISETEETNSLTEEEIALLNQVVEEAHQEMVGEHQEISTDNNEETVETEPIIPENSSTLLVDDTTSRFSDAVWFNNIQSKTIVVAGCGGIGSWCILLLARMKPKSMFIYDDDLVESVNMAGQLYRVSDINDNKVDAISQIVEEYADYHSIFAIDEKFTAESEASDIMICGFDNMAARNTFFTSWLSHIENKSEEDKAKCLFIDGRLNAEEFQIFCIAGNDSYNIDRYAKEFIFPDDMAEATSCSYKQTTYCANMIASYMVNLFVNFCAQEVGAFRDLPFFTSYNASIMYLKTEM